MWKAGVPGTGMHDHRTPGGRQAIQSLCPRESASPGDGIWATVFVPRRAHPEMQLKNCWSGEKAMLDCKSYLINLSLNPLPTFFFLIKTLSWDETLRWFLRVHNLPFFSDHQHLHNVSIKIQSLSLPIGSGSDRQHKPDFSGFSTSVKWVDFWNLHVDVPKNLTKPAITSYWWTRHLI